MYFRPEEVDVENIRAADGQGGNPLSAHVLRWDSTLVSRLGENLRPTTYGTTLPSGRIVYNISEPRAVLSLPPAGLFEAAHT